MDVDSEMDCEFEVSKITVFTWDKVLLMVNIYVFKCMANVQYRGISFAYTTMLITNIDMANTHIFQWKKSKLYKTERNIVPDVVTNPQT